MTKSTEVVRPVSRACLKSLILASFMLKEVSSLGLTEYLLDSCLRRTYGFHSRSNCCWGPGFFRKKFKEF